MSRDAEKIIREASDYASNELRNISEKRKVAAMYGRMSRYIRIEEDAAAKEYYKKYGRHLDNKDGNPTHILLIAHLLLFLMFAFVANIIFYLPVHYLSVVWLDIRPHDAVFVTILINSILGMAVGGIWSELGTKRNSFIAGMRAEADNNVVGKYHEAQFKVDEHHASQGNLPDFESNW